MTARTGRGEIRRRPADLWCLSIQRRINQEPFSPEEKRRLAVLSNHLSSVAAIARALGFSAASAALDAFEVSNTAVFLLNRLGQIIRANRSAENLLTGDIKSSGRRLVAADANASAALDRRLHQLLWASSGAALGPPTPLPRFRQRPLLAYLLKLSSLTTNILSDCQAAIVLVDPDKRWRPPEASLRVSFGLTAAEARLAARIASGDSLENIAEELGVTKETSRNQLKSIFQKIGVHRQAELVAIFARLLTQ
jgi:DNA-binding CsgD family transcriptional regulator